MVSSANYNLAIGSGLHSQVNAPNLIKFNPQAEDEKKSAIIRKAKIKYRKIKQSDKYSVQGAWSDDYVIPTDSPDQVSESEKTMTELMSRYRLITFKIPVKRTNIYLKSCYKIENIVSEQRKKGEGTRAVQSLLEISLADKDTEGRIIVYSEIIDGLTSPAGFFYKLGFRFIDKSMNDILEKQIIQKIGTDFPKLTGMMYLPKTNINKLAMYNMKYM